MNQKPSGKKPTDKAAPGAAQPSAGADGTDERRGRASVRDAFSGPALAAPRRAGSAFLRGGRRIARRGTAAEPVWPRRLDRAVLIGLLAILVVSFFDPIVVAYVRTADGAFIGFMHAITDIGLSGWYLVPTALALVVIALADWRRYRHRGRARMVAIFGHSAFLFAAVAVTGIAVNLLKVMIGRARPILFDEVGAFHFDPFTADYAFASFPSGHATTMGAVTMVLVLWFPRYAVLIAEIGLFLAATRIAANAHYPSDVAAGLMLGALLTLVMARAAARRRAVFRPRDGSLLPAVIGGRSLGRSRRPPG